MKIGNVFSAFDGLSGAQVALNQAGIKYGTYYASEVDKFAIQIAQKNYPETVQLGDIRDIKGKDLGNIHLMIGGSPCTGFSFAGKRLNFEDPQSKLFFEFVRLLKEIKPRYFLLENVRMANKHKKIITEHMGVEPIALDSSLLSAQRRLRLYWTNIPGVKQPQDQGIVLKDILESDATEPMYSNIYGGFKENKPREHYNKSVTIRPAKGGGHIPSVTKKIEDKYYLSQKGKDYVSDPTRLKKQHTAISDGSDKALPVTPVIARWIGTHIKVEDKYYLSDKMVDYIMADKYNNKGEIDPEKARTLTKSYHKMQRANVATYVTGNHAPFDKSNIRRLLPIECERLQTLPDNYTQGVSDTQRYRSIGNGFTTLIVSHILKYMEGNPVPLKFHKQLELR